jgi:hypothetical protein
MDNPFKTLDIKLEPEQMISESMYLLQLCQQDLNFGRKQTIWPRARKAAKLCKELEEMFSYNPIA